jgi:hypothetical protein
MTTYAGLRQIDSLQLSSALGVMYKAMTMCTLPILASLLLGAATPAPLQKLPSDTTRVVQGFDKQAYAWGTVMLRKGTQLRAYLPATDTGLDMLLAYYLVPPDSQPGLKPKLLHVKEVRWMQVRGQYSELLDEGKFRASHLAARRVSGAVELFVVKINPPRVISFLSSTPVLSSPVAGSDKAGPLTWYLRRDGGSPVVVSPQGFASQMAAFLADDAELARRVAAGQPGYRLGDLQDVIQQYNQHMSSRK